MKKSITYLLLTLVVCFLSTACSSKKNKTNTGTIEKYFKFEGLKYRSYLTLTMHDNGEVTGIILEDDYSEQYAVYPFYGTQKNNKLHVTFSKERPIIGMRSEWTNKPWELRTEDDKDILCVHFKVQDFSTMKWENSTYCFEACTAQEIPTIN